MKETSVVQNETLARLRRQIRFGGAVMVCSFIAIVVLMTGDRWIGTSPGDVALARYAMVACAGLLAVAFFATVGPAMEHIAGEYLRRIEVEQDAFEAHASEVTLRKQCNELVRELDALHEPQVDEITRRHRNQFQLQP